MAVAWQVERLSIPESLTSQLLAQGLEFIILKFTFNCSDC